MGLTPLHSAIYGYHASRVEETCQFIDELLNAGANAQIVNKVSLSRKIVLCQVSFCFYLNISNIIKMIFFQIVRRNSCSSCRKYRRSASDIKVCGVSWTRSIKLL